MTKYKNEPWFKINRRLFGSSVWEEDLHVRIVWLTLLALAQEPANQNMGPGIIAITPGNLMRMALVSRDQLEDALKRLTSPDPYSRTDPGKARLEVLENGYRIPAFELYNDRDVYDRWKEQKREAGKRRAAEAVRVGGRFVSSDSRDETEAQ
jgi:hypothetical protein